MTTSIKALLACLFLTFSLQAESEWRAAWIGLKSDNSNQWTCFRKLVTLDKAPHTAIAKIAVDSKYWLWINGDLVVFEGQLKRGPTPLDTYYDSVDLSPYLKTGKNSIALLVWYFGKDGFSHKSSGRSAMIFDANIDGEDLLSGNDWKAIRHPSFGETKGEEPNFRLPESNILFDASLDLPCWQLPDYDDSDWTAALEIGYPPSTPWNRLLPRPIPQWKDFGLKEYVNYADIPKVSKGQTLKLKLPYNAQVTPFLKIDAPKAGLKIDLRMDNYRGGKANNVRSEYITRAGVQTYENLGWMNGHEVHYTIPAGIKILSLMYRETGYDTEFTGLFECDDDFLNRYREKALRTLYINMRDTYFDCPDRERAQWWGDVVNQMGEAFYALDRRADLLAKKGIIELMNWQKDDDTIHSPVPGIFDKELPMQMLNSVGEYGFWTYYLYTGDLETIRTIYPAVKRYIAIWELGSDGLVIPRKGGWAWGDWGKNKDMLILYNAWYYLALKGQHKMATALKVAADLPLIETKMAQIEANYNLTFWTGSEYRSPNYEGATDDRAQALSVISGLAKPSQFPAIRKVLREQSHSSPYMEKYVGEALFVMGYANDAIARTKKRFKEMVEHPYTTLWEDWKIGGSGGGTINHAWSGGALTLLTQYAAGIAPIEAGFSRFQVLPKMGPLKMIRTTVSSPKGRIILNLTNHATSFTMQLTSPEGSRAIVGIPRNNFKTSDITINGNLSWKDGKLIQTLDGVTYLEQTSDYIKLEVSPGIWNFHAKRLPIISTY